MKIDELYRKVFEAESEGDYEKAKEYRDLIEEQLFCNPVIHYKELVGEELDEEGLKMKEEFLTETRKKAFHKRLRRVVKGDELDDVTMATAVSSMLTHSLIQMKKKGTNIFDYLDIRLQSKVLNDYIGGKINGEVVRQIYEERFPSFKKYIGIELPGTEEGCSGEDSKEG